MSGSNIRLYRLIHTRFVTLEDFARAAGQSKRRIRRLCMGQRMPDLDELDRYARVLDVPPLSLLELFLPEWSPNRQQEGRGKL